MKIENDIIEACVDNNLDIVKNFLINGGDVHYDDNSYLMQAAANGATEVLVYLMSQGADVSAKNGFALKISAENGNLDIVKALIESSRIDAKHINRALVLSCKSNKLEVVKYLFENNAVLEDEKEILENSANRISLELLQYLVIEQNKSIEFVLNSKYSATKVKEWAVKYKQFKILNDRLEENLNNDHQLIDKKMKI